MQFTRIYKRNFSKSYDTELWMTLRILKCSPSMFLQSAGGATVDTVTNIATEQDSSAKTPLNHTLKTLTQSTTCLLELPHTFFAFHPTNTTRLATNSIVPIVQDAPPKAIAPVNDPPLRAMRAPPIGDPVSPAKAEIVKTVPVRTPISVIGDSLAHNAGVRPMPAPEDIAKRDAKRMMGASPDEGSQRPRMRMLVKTPMTTITLKCPTLSAIAFGTVRPRILDSHQLIVTITRFQIVLRTS
jgi:hypothetical protein